MKLFKLSEYSIKKYNIKIIVLIAALCTIGYLVLKSAMVNDIEADSTLQKQIIGIAIGAILMVVLSLMDYHYLLHIAPIIYIVVAVFLIFVLIFGVSVSDATRWINIAGVQFQPSEFAKIGVIICFASYFNVNKDNINKPKTLLTGLLLFALLAFLVFREPDLSTTIVIVIIFLAMLFVAKLSYKYILGALAVIVPLFGVFIFLITRENQTILHEYQLNRILSWINPDKYASSGLTMQQDNSILAISSGQFWGKGLNTTSFESVKNGNFLSEENCDFIFSVIGEELGFFGSVIVLILIAFLVAECFKIASRAKDLGGRLIAVGIGTLIAIQTFVNVSVATGLLPNTGLPLPFMSAGVSSLVSIFMGIGLVLNVGLQRKNSDFDL